VGSGISGISRVGVGVWSLESESQRVRERRAESGESESQRVREPESQRAESEFEGEEAEE
jgi:hypothetical protein